MSIVMPNFALLSFAAITCCWISFFYNDVFHPRVLAGLALQPGRVVRAVMIAGGALAALSYFLPVLRSDPALVFVSFALLLVSLLAANLLISRACLMALPRDRLLLVGSGQLARTVQNEIERRPDLPIEIVGFLEWDHESERQYDIPVRSLGAPSDIVDISNRHRVSRVVVGVEELGDVDSTNELLRNLIRLRTHGVIVEHAEATIESLTGKVPIQWVKPNWAFLSAGFSQGPFGRATQRVFQLLATAGLILVLSPVMLTTGLVVLLASGRPLLYRQIRVGKDGTPFELIKFRTMKVDAEADGKARWAIKGDPRVTSVGRWMRKYRLDETPQLVNVIRGQMNLIGPRPERPEFVNDLARDIPFYEDRHSIRPGLTGWAQVCYRYGDTVADAWKKLEYDLFYVKHRSLFLDAVILMKTVKLVCLGHGGQ